MSERIRSPSSVSRRVLEQRSDARVSAGPIHRQQSIPCLHWPGRCEHACAMERDVGAGVRRPDIPIVDRLAQYQEADRVRPEYGDSDELK